MTGDIQCNLLKIFKNFFLNSTLRKVNCVAYFVVLRQEPIKWVLPYHALNSKFANFETPCINKKYWQVTLWQRYFLSSVVMNSSVGSLIACLSKFVSQSALAVIDIF
jgi:hypothetical protein